MYMMVFMVILCVLGFSGGFVNVVVIVEFSFVWLRVGLKMGDMVVGI